MNAEEMSVNGGTGPRPGTTMDESEEALVARAAAPNLASLFKQAKDAGLIQPGNEYGST